MEFRALYDKHVRPLSPIPTPLSPMLDYSGVIKAVLFDVYGTLFISHSGDISLMEPLHSGIGRFRQLAATHRIPFSPEELVQRLASEIEKSHAASKEKQIDFPEVDIVDIWMTVLSWDDRSKAKAFALEFELIVNPVFPMPHLEEILRYLNQKLLHMGIISNAQFFTPDLFEYFLNKPLFQLGFAPDLIILSYRNGHAKPSPYLFELAKESLKKKHISADNVLYVGNDMLNDILAARTAGFNTALFAGDLRSLRLRKDHEACKDIHPDIIITDLNQLVDLI